MVGKFDVNSKTPDAADDVFRIQYSKIMPIFGTNQERDINEQNKKRSGIMSKFISNFLNDSRILDWTSEFVRYPSPQTDKFESEPAVLGFLNECVEPIADGLDLPHRRDTMENLIVEVGPKNYRHSILLMAYAMCHPASNMENPYGGEELDTEQGIAIRGRGVAEQKGSLAAALAATYSAHISGRLKGRLILAVSTAGETGRHDAASAILDALPELPEFGVIVIGTNNQPTLGNKGRIDIEITVHGQASHSSTPWLGVNAIDGATEVMQRLQGLDIGNAEHPALGRATLTPTAIRSFPEATHTVQSKVRLVYDRRLLPGQQVEMALAQVKNAIGDIAPCTVEVERGAFMYPGEIEENCSLINHIKEGFSRAGIEVPGIFYSHGCLDAGYLIHKGCEATMWGPGQMYLWHSDNEILLVKDLIKGADAYFGFIESYLMD